MKTRPDLSSPKEIARLVRTFYARVALDDLLSPVFNDQAQVHWPEHWDNITAFWCKLELGIPGFAGTPTQTHSALSSVIPFRAEQFGRWVQLFHDTIDKGWDGPHAASIKQRAAQIAKMQSRLVVGAEAWDDDQVCSVGGE